MSALGQKQKRRSHRTGPFSPREHSSYTLREVAICQMVDKPTASPH
jgi:hypothetical protein